MKIYHDMKIKTNEQLNGFFEFVRDEYHDIYDDHDCHDVDKLSIVFQSCIDMIRRNDHTIHDDNRMRLSALHNIAHVDIPYDEPTKQKIIENVVRILQRFESVKICQLADEFINEFNCVD